MAKKESLQVKKPEVVVEKADSTSGEVLIANHHTGRIILPRSSSQGVAVNPLILEPGFVNVVSAEEWSIRKQNTVVGYYLDKGLLAEVKRMDVAVPVTDGTTSDLDSIVPENLREETQVGETGAAVEVRRAKAGEITVG